MGRIRKCKVMFNGIFLCVLIFETFCHNAGKLFTAASCELPGTVDFDMLEEREPGQ